MSSNPFWGKWEHDDDNDDIDDVGYNSDGSPYVREIRKQGGY